MYFQVNIARALYYGADVVIFDDPLSAVDANVGKALFHSAIQGLVAQGKTVILVTHALHFLSQCDYIYTLAAGRIAEAGTYPELIARGGEFARLDREFGGAEAQEGADGEDEPQVQVVSVEDAKAKSAGAGTGKLEGKLIVKEHRTTGGVAWSGECNNLILKTYPSAETLSRSVWILFEGRRGLEDGAGHSTRRSPYAGQPSRQFVLVGLVGGQVRV